MTKRLEEIIKDESQLSEKQRALMAIGIAAHLIDENYETVLAPFNITVHQYRALRVLLKAYPDSLSVQQIRENIHDHKSDVPRLIMRLRKLNFVKQQKPKGGVKAYRISLTEEGFDTLDRIARQMDLKKPVSNISNDEAKQLNKLLLKIIHPFLEDEK